MRAFFSRATECQKSKQNIYKFTIVGAFGSNRKKRAFKLESTYQEGIFGVDIMN